MEMRFPRSVAARSRLSSSISLRRGLAHALLSPGLLIVGRVQAGAFLVHTEQRAKYSKASRQGKKAGWQETDWRATAQQAAASTTIVDAWLSIATTSTHQGASS